MEPPPSLPAKALAALVAGALAFALAAGGLLLLAGRAFEGWIFLAAFAAVPAAAIALLPFGARIFCFVLGLLATAGTWLLDPSGPHNPMILLPWIAWCLAGAAVVAELCVRAVRALLGRQTIQA
jgi:hypothetical protein